MVHTGQATPTIAVFERHSDTCEMLQCSLASAGFAVHGCTDENVATPGFDLSVFMGAHDPAAVIWDVPPPFASNWMSLRSLMHIGPLANRPIVVTATNTAMLVACQRQEPGVEILIKPYDLDVLAQCVAGGQRERARHDRARLMPVVEGYPVTIRTESAH